MKEIEVGDYVRFDDGQIKWVTQELKDFIDEHESLTEKDLVEFLGRIKHSKQLIDLIEVGDYVNGREVKHIAMFEGFPDYPQLIFVDETHLIPDDTCKNDEIETILTKEQFDANCYKVGVGG